MLKRRTPLRSRPPAPRPPRVRANTYAIAMNSVVPKLHGGAITRIDAAAPPATIEKPKPWRSRTFLNLCRGQLCHLRVPGVCIGGIETTVPCHGNGSVFGKAAARKADDCYSCPGCRACHEWLDQGRAEAAAKRAVFMAAHSRWILAVRVIATNRMRAARDRRAALAGLERLGATPLPIDFLTPGASP